MRLDKFFSEQKILSRRETAVAVKKGRIAVNGITATSSDMKITVTDEITLDGKFVEYRKFVYVMLNKPDGYVCSTDDPRDKTVLELLPEQLRKVGLFPCGRLDKDTVGLVILTSDGKSAHRALSPSKHVEKKYLFVVADEYSDEDVTAIEHGLILANGETTKPCKINRIDEKSGYITLTESKYHEIKRLFGARKNRITFLKRVSFGGITLSDLPRGEWRYLTPEEELLFIK